MKLLFSARPAFGHVYPMLPLALAARDVGHDVAFATTGQFLQRLRRLGFTTLDVGVSIEAARDELVASLGASTEMPTDLDGRPDVVMGARLFIDGVARATAADLRALLPQVEPDVVVFEQYDFGAAIAAHRAGIPAVCHSLSPRPPDELTANRVVETLLSWLWAEHGVDAPTLDVHTGDVYVDLFPDVLQSPATRANTRRLRLRPVPYAEPTAIVPRWLHCSGRRLVYLTLGTVVATDDVLAPAIDGLARLDADVLVALGSAAGTGFGTLPPNVHVEAFVDQPTVLRHADLAVHHGGSGTVLAALTSGTPQLLLPKGADQFWNADAMAAADLVGVLEPGAATAAAITDAARAELDRLRPSAASARAELLGLPGPREALDELLAHLGLGRRAA
jgi:UDP:flavonoid glycosyltransferase YjiC (YdhE family)